MKFGGRIMIGKSRVLILEPRGWRCFLLALVGFLVTCNSASAQTATGRIIGTITDPQGAPIAGAKVAVTNTGTNVRSEAVTNADGFYQVLNLPIGTYTVAAEREGFSKVLTAAEPLDINQALRIDVRMKVGSLVDVVKVEAQAAQVETVNATLGGTVTGAPIQNLLIPSLFRTRAAFVLTCSQVFPCWRLAEISRKKKVS